MRLVPVRYSPNAEHLHLVTDEFGVFALVIADTFEEAYEEALCIMHERDGSCDHGIIESELMDSPARQEAEESCDCSLSDDGPVWDIYLGVTRTAMTREQFEERFGDECEEVEYTKVETALAT